jgi:hypothetical protein
VILGNTSQAHAYDIVTQSTFLCNENSVCEWPETSGVCPSDCGTIGISKYTDQRAKYVDQECQFNGDGLSNSCASSNGGAGRYNDFQHALDTLSAGDTLYVHPGDYWRGDDLDYVYDRHQIGYQISGEGTATQPIIVTAADVNNKPVLHSYDPQGISTINHPALEGRVEGRGDYIILDNLEVRGMIGFWRGVFNNSQIQNIDCSVGWGQGCDGNWSCIRVQGMDPNLYGTNNIIHHNYVHDVAVPAIMSGSCDNTRARPAGLKEFFTSNTIWEFNTVSNCHTDGYDHHQMGSNTTVRFNDFNQIRRTGIRYGGVYENTYTYGNSVHGNTETCIASKDREEVETSTDVIYNNICSYTGRVFVSEPDFSLEFYNNIVSNVTNHGDMTLNIGVEQKSAGTTLYLDNNAYDSNAGYSYGDDGYNPMDHALATWQQRYNQDGNSQEDAGGACDFVNPPESGTDTNYDFTPTNTFCTSGSTEGGALGPYGLVSCIGHTCGDVDGVVPGPDPEPEPEPNPIDLTENSFVSLNPRMVSASVMSLADNNVIFAGDRRLDLDLYERASLYDPNQRMITPGMVITGTGPFELGSSVSATDTPAHASMLGRVFVMPHSRFNHTYHMISPQGDATVQINLEGTISTHSLTQGEPFHFETGEVNGNVGAVITSDEPILVSHTAQASWGSADASPVAPAARELWGVCSGSAYVSAVQDNTQVTIYNSANTSVTEVTMNAGEKRAVCPPLPWRELGQGRGPAVHIVANRPVGAVQIADGDGADQTAFYPTSLLNSRFGIPKNSQYIAIACPSADTRITLYRPDGSTDTQHCSAIGDRPGKAFFGIPQTNGAHIPVRSYLESTRPIYVIYEVTDSGDEHNLIGTDAYVTPLFSADMEGSDWMDVRSTEAGGGGTITFPVVDNNRVAQFNYRAGYSNEVWLKNYFGAYTDNNGEPVGEPVDELWINVEYEISDTAIYNPNPGQASKILYVNWSSPSDNTRTSQVVLGAIDNGNGHRFRMSKEVFNADGSWRPGGDWLVDPADDPIPVNEKLYLQLHIRNSTHGAANGFVELYNNGELVFERRDVVLNDYPGHSPNLLELTSQISHTPPGSGANGYARYDNVSLYDSDPGAFTAPY